MAEYAKKRSPLDGNLKTLLEDAQKSLEGDREDLRSRLLKSGLPEDHADLASDVWLRNTAFSKIRKRLEI